MTPSFYDLRPRCFSPKAEKHPRSGERTSALPTHRYLHSFPTRRSSDLADLRRNVGTIEGLIDDAVIPRSATAMLLDESREASQIGRENVCTPDTPISTLFPYTTLFRSGRSPA